MPEVEIRDKNNNTVGKINLSDDVFNINAKSSVIHEAVVNFHANQRQGTHATKTKGLVSGGGKKPWKQKHTGRARAGSNRSPIWRGGGIVFGPQPRDYGYNLPKKVRRLALITAFNQKLSNGEVVILDKFSIDKPKTKEMKLIFGNLGLAGKSVLIILHEKDDSVTLSARNLLGVDIIKFEDLNTYNITSFDMLLITKESFAKLGDVKSS
ncbi:MAG: 50S ribosomal protein L4 [Nitrospirae bacterium RBG_13_39_12]|nr:MAG: 50S ribosomal protein L4 [Nitrospirae bacterium RBG_13_39_12]